MSDNSERGDSLFTLGLKRYAMTSFQKAKNALGRGSREESATHISHAKNALNILFFNPRMDGLNEEENILLGQLRRECYAIRKKDRVGVLLAGADPKKIATILELENKATRG